MCVAVVLFVMQSRTAISGAGTPSTMRESTSDSLGVRGDAGATTDCVRASIRRTRAEKISAFSGLQR
jgi:hypothetical protein